MTAKAATTLRYADLSQPGYGRRRRGKGFSYLGIRGKPLRDKRKVAYCRSLVIPPAWNQVWISADRCAHILSTGVDAASRKQYIYHPAWQERQNLLKFEDMVSFARHLSQIRQAVTADLARSRHDKRKMVATTVGLIDEGLIRVGNETYTKRNGSYGATTLRRKHVSIDGNEITLSYRGKSGQQREIEIENQALAQSVKTCQELPGQRLFRYTDRAGKVSSVDSADVNAYLRRVTGQRFTAKDFRTWGGTVAACVYAYTLTDMSGNALARAAVRHVAATLGNTQAIARRYYIHPKLLEAIAGNQLPPKARRRRKDLSIVETSVARFLESASSPLSET